MEKKTAAAGCDEDRTTKIIRWVLIEGTGDNQFYHGRRVAHDGAYNRSDMGVFEGIRICHERHDRAAIEAASACEAAQPGFLWKTARAVLGIGP